MGPILCKILKKIEEKNKKQIEMLRTGQGREKKKTKNKKQKTKNKKQKTKNKNMISINKLTLESKWIKLQIPSTCIDKET